MAFCMSQLTLYSLFARDSGVYATDQVRTHSMVGSTSYTAPTIDIIPILKQFYLQWLIMPHEIYKPCQKRLQKISIG